VNIKKSHWVVWDVLQMMRERVVCCSSRVGGVGSWAGGVDISTRCSELAQLNETRITGYEFIHVGTENKAIVIVQPFLECPSRPIFLPQKKRNRKRAGEK
jgi:hypothetical protein